MTKHIFDFTEKEREAFINILQEYRDHQEDLYGCPEDPLTLFTPPQVKLFTRFDIVSVKKEQNK